MSVPYASIVVNGSAGDCCPAVLSTPLTDEKAAELAGAFSVLADPVRLVDAQRHVLLGELGTAQRAALAEPGDSVAGLLLEGVVLRLQADLRWLEACARFWTQTKGRS